MTTEKMTKRAVCALCIGFLAFIFSSGRWNIPIAAWIWPAAFLYYSRSVKSVWGFLPLAALIPLGNVLHWLNVLDAGYALDAAVSLIWSVTWILPYAADRLLYKRLPAFLSTLLLPGVFVTLEFLRQFTPVGSFGVTAYTQSGFLPLLQSVSVIGSFGLSFLIIWFGPVLLYACQKKPNWKGMTGGFLAVLSVLMIFGFIRLNAVPAEEMQMIKAASVVGPYYRQYGDGTYESLSYEESVSYLTEEAKRAATEGAEVACWNEEAFDIPDVREAEFLDKASELAGSNDMILILAYETEDTDGSEGGLSTNKLVILQPDGSSAEYTKTHLVPVIESSEYVKGSGRIPTVRTERGVFSAVICFDDSYISFNHGFGAKTNEAFRETDILFVPSWDWSSVASVHTQSAKFRALENGYALLKPTYDGLSTAVDRCGRELFLSDTEDSGYDSVRCVDIPVTGEQTFYARHAAFIDLIFASSGVILVLLGGLYPFSRKDQGRNTEK